MAGALLCAVAGAFGAEGVPTLLQVGNTDGLAQVELTWASDADTFYEIYSTTNLAGPWELAVAEPLASTNLIGQMQLLSADTSRFFQVRKYDNQGPAVTARYPQSGSANIGPAEPLSVSVADPSGVDANSISVRINGGSPLPLDGSGVSVTANGFAYDPALASTNWGGSGGTVTVSFACADLKGNATFEEWSFYLEVPVTVADNILVLGAAAAQSYAVVQPETGIGLLAAAPGPVIRPLASGLSIVEVYADRLVIAYTGDAHGIPMGALIANNDYDNLFYRRVTGLSDNPAAKQVTVYTEDVPFTQLITGGSFDSRDFIVSDAQGLSALDIRPLDYESVEKSFSQEGTYTVTRDWGPVTFNGSAGYALTGGMDFSTLVEWFKVRNFTAGVYAGLDLTLDGSLVFDATTEPVDESLPLIDELRLVTVKGSVYGIPVMVYLYLDLDLCVEAASSGSVTLDAGAEFHASFSNRVTFSGGEFKREPETGAVKMSLTYDPPALSGGMEGEIYMYLKPTLTMRLYNALGVGLDYRRGPLVTGAYSASVNRFQFCLYDRRSVNLSLWCMDVPNVLKGVIDPANLPEWNLWTSPDDLKKTWYWPEVTAGAPSFTLHPAGGSYASGVSVTLTAAASGSPAPAYQWCQNGAALPGRTAATLSFTMGAAAAGTYTCKARNSLGTATSQSAAVTLASSAPAGMALIPAGSFQMGDNLGDGWSAEMPVHTVYVSAFYMDKTEVTWSKWQEVRAWAAANGYDIGTVGAGKAADHPVHSVNWYDCVKWLNARSQKEGRTPCYRRGGAVYKVEEHDDVTCDWSAVGYRLPTEAEWEKAARGGLSGRRFPWGDTIDHSRANYYGYPSGYTYDQGYAGYDTRYTTGGYPYTSPAGAFAANGYGLYDMAGNVWEWCWDWFDDYPSGSVNNPRGLSAASTYWGSRRVLRGGGWADYADRCRSAHRTYDYPADRHYIFGFRAVLPPGQQ